MEPIRAGLLPMSHRHLWPARIRCRHGQDARGLRAGRSCSVGSSRRIFLCSLLLLLAAGTASAPSPAPKLLPETAVLDRVDGRLLHVDANDTWLFELTMDVKTPDYQLPAGTRFVLLPSVTLGRLIADVNERVAPRYRLSARVTRFREQELPLSDLLPAAEQVQGRAKERRPKSHEPNPPSESPQSAIGRPSSPSRRRSWNN